MTEKTKTNNKNTPKPPKKITERYLYNAGLYYLKRYTASVKHFRFIMTRKIKKSCAYHEKQCYDTCLSLLDETVEKMIELGFLNDQQFAYGMVNSYRKRGLSKRGILSRLQQKGLEPDLILEKLATIDEAIIDNDQDPDLEAAIIHAKKKKIVPFSKKDNTDPKEINRALGSFARAGYSYDIANKVMTQYNTED